MAIYSGAKFNLKLETTPANFQLVAGLQAKSFNVQNSVANITNLASGQWQRLDASIGSKQVVVSGEGIFNNTDVTAEVLQAAIVGQSRSFRLEFADGKSLQGEFAIQNIALSGEDGNDQLYSITLASAGDITYSDA